MRGSEPSRSSTGRWSAAPEDAEARRLLLGRRVAYFGAVFFFMSLAFYVRNVTLIAIAVRGWPPLGHPALLLHVAAMGLAALQWLICRSGRRSMGELELIDATGLIGSMALYCALVFAEAMQQEHAIAVHSAGAEVLLVALIMLALVVTHAVISTPGRRTTLGTGGQTPHRPCGARSRRHAAADRLPDRAPSRSTWRHGAVVKAQRLSSIDGRFFDHFGCRSSTCHHTRVLFRRL